MSKSQRTRVQHYLPQFYLRNFSSNPLAKKENQRVWCLDKKTCNIANYKIKVVACEDYFYDLPLSILSHEYEDDVQETEYSLSRVEYYQYQILTYILSCIANGTPWLQSNNNKYKLAYILSLMFLRTPAIRNAYCEALKNVPLGDLKAMAERDIRPTLNGNIIPDGTDLIDSLARNYHEVHIFNSTENGGQIEPLACFLSQQFLWFLGKNTTLLPFYTSDTPIVYCKYGSQTKGRINIEDNSGIGNLNNTIMYPITPKLSIYLLPIHVKDILPIEGSVINFDYKDVMFWNKLHVIESEYSIFCNDNKFKDALKVISDYPECVDRTRVRLSRNASTVKLLEEELSRHINS